MGPYPRRVCKKTKSYDGWIYGQKNGNEIMSKLYNEQKIVKLDPLGSRLDDVGLQGGVGRLNRLKLRKTKKIIQKTPNKKFKSEHIFLYNFSDNTIFCIFFYIKGEIST